MKIDLTKYQAISFADQDDIWHEDKLFQHGKILKMDITMGTALRLPTSVTEKKKICK